MGLWTAALLVFVINLSSGYWRASVRRLSARWFLAALLPLILIAALAIFSRLGGKLMGFPVMVGAYLVGQFVGGKLRHIIQGRGPGRGHG